MDIWKILSPLHSTHLEVFFYKISFIFHFLIQIHFFKKFSWNATGRYRYRSEPVTPITAVRGLVAAGGKTLCFSCTYLHVNVNS
jgi:hypothetical protein